MISISYPKPGAGRIVVELPYVEGQALKYYCKSVPRLISTFLRCRAVLATDRKPLRLSHVPRDGEFIFFEPSGRQ